MMRRIAVVLICTGFWTSNASAATCDAVGDIVGGFAGAATGYGFFQNIGAASNWVSAGLYGAGIAAASLGGNAAGEAVCNNFRNIVYTIAEINCIAGEYICDYVSEVAYSIGRDFQICPSCTADEVFSAFLMEDSARAELLRWIQRQRNWQIGYTTALPRNHIGPLSPIVLNSYFAGQQSALSRMRSRVMFRIEN
jgi:hypothetical protein